MSEDKDSGSKTEKATPHRLKEARKKGDIQKARDLTSTASLAFTLALLWFIWQYSAERVVVLFDAIFSTFDQDFFSVLSLITDQSTTTFLLLCALVLVPVVAFGMIVEFLQVGSLFATEKIKPKMSNLNIVTGVKRMFNMDNFFDLLKNIIKALILGTIAYLVVKSALPSLVKLPLGNITHVLALFVSMMMKLVLYVLLFFTFVMVLDIAYRRHAFAKKMRMSMRDIRKEHKENDGDPQLKGQRKQLHQEWSQESKTGAAGNATALVVNPTHVAIAIKYEAEDDSSVPIITAQGQNHVAQAMRDSASSSQVPVVRNEHLARTLLRDTEEGDPVPEGLFDIIAEVIHWANQVSKSIESTRNQDPEEDIPQVPDPPGEDLTQYPLIMKSSEGQQLESQQLKS